MKLFIICSIPFIISYALSRVVIWRSAGWGLIDLPNARSSHSVPTPRGGGIGIVSGIIAGVAVVYAAGLERFTSLAWLAALTAAMAVTGFVSDRCNSPVRLRLAAQLTMALAAVFILGRAGISWPGALIAIGIAGAVNFYNFMDGIDGLAGAQAAIGGAALAAFGFITGQSWLIFSGLIMAGAAAGFLALNVTPAKIFMGDTGSYAIGFFFACVPLLDGRLFVPVMLVMGTFLFDTIVTLALKPGRGIRWHEAHRSHFYQRAVALGYSHLQVTAAMGALTILFSAGACIYLVSQATAVKTVIVAAELSALVLCAALISKNRRGLA
ncbi:MAG: hypothetical protein A2219_03440 [Elusimicrobia bacterium RIFOXYA2_FULL_50_26]|nr:MAG: hypothetical protein A2219_03440 [Elusimicrobia bacterium RIFOXYA2_FULL_50_26]